MKYGFKIFGVQIWKSPYIWDRRIFWDPEDHSELRLWTYTKVPFHFDSAWRFMRIWIFCFQLD